MQELLELAQLPCPLQELTPAHFTVAEDAPAANTRDYVEYPAGYSFATGTYVGAFVSGQTSEQ